MASALVPGRPTCSLGAVNGNLDALVFTVEQTLTVTSGESEATSFADEVATYRAQTGSTYRGVLDIVRSYVDLV